MTSTPTGMSRQMSTFVGVAFLTYMVRDGFGGALRYYLPKVHLDLVWFAPDLMSFVCIGYFVHRVCLQERNPVATIFVANIVISTIIGAYFMASSPSAILSAIKMVSPFFVGFLFRGRRFEHESRLFRSITAACVIVSAIGLLLAPYIQYPWIGETFDTLGYTRQVGKLWWQGSDVRYAGFANDSTMAAYMTIIPAILLATHSSIIFNIFTVTLAFAAAVTSTSKTTIFVLAVYVALYGLFVAGRPQPRIQPLRRIALLSYLTILIPIILIIALQGLDLKAIDPLLASMQDRIDNTWQIPFQIVYEKFPIGLLIGCGVGCFTYPQLYTSMASYFYSLDNFYLVTYLMLGAPFILYVIASMRGAMSSDPVKLILIVLLNIYAITVQGYGPSFATLMLGLMVSDMFLPVRRRAVAEHHLGHQPGSRTGSPLMSA